MAESIYDLGAGARLIWILTREGYELADLARRVARWWMTMSDLASPAGLLLGIGGCVLLMVREKAVLPICLLAAHFFAGLILPGFNQYNRTGSYAVMVLCLGAGWFSMSIVRDVIVGWRNGACRKAGLAGLFLAVALTVHGIQEFGQIAQPKRVNAWRS